MVTREAEELFVKGLEAIEHNHPYLARTCLEQALALERSPEICSYLALCRAQTGGRLSEAIALAEEAVAGAPTNSWFYLNLGKVYLLAGDKKKALDFLRKGLQFERNPAILQELEAHGTRKPPPFPGLKRDHPLNRFAGMLLSRLGLR
jgi:tetratricopeptide (TPR) repeat protein